MAARKVTLSPELKKFGAACRRLRADVAAYVADGGDYATADATERKLLKRRDALPELMRRLFSSDSQDMPTARAEYDETASVMRGFRERASEARVKKARDAELERRAALRADPGSAYDAELRAMAKRGRR